MPPSVMRPRAAGRSAWRCAIRSSRSTATIPPSAPNSRRSTPTCAPRGWNPSSFRAVAKVGGIGRGEVFLPFHYGYWDRGGADYDRAANELTLTGWDPVSKQPHFKYAAVSISRVRSNDDRDPGPARLAGRRARPSGTSEPATTGAKR